VSRSQRLTVSHILTLKPNLYVRRGWSKHTVKGDNSMVSAVYDMYTASIVGVSSLARIGRR